jgi:hypothetical protein
MRARNIIIAAGLSICCFASIADCEDLDMRFSEFRVGDRCAVVIAAMGEPTSKSVGSTLGVAHSRIQWIAGPRAYVAICVADWLVSKRVCQSLPVC